MNNLQNIIEAAKKEIGTAETPNNMQKYGEAYGWNGVAWCVIFIWYLFHTNGLDDLFPKVAHCNQVEAYAKEKGRWITGNYKPGDLVIFDYNKDLERDHIELIIQTGAGYIRTIGGNVGDKVAEQNHFLETAKIVGAYRPNYDSEGDTDIDVPTNTENQTEEFCTAVVPWLKIGAVGLQTELMQYALCRNGYLPENSRKQNGFFDGEFGTGTLAALESFQTDKSISPIEYGTLGPETIQALIGV